MRELLTVEMQIAERARKYPDEALTNLHEMIDVRLLEACFATLNKGGASGIDGKIIRRRKQNGCPAYWRHSKVALIVPLGKCE